MEELVGQVLDHYEIVQLLGEGGMGAVFKARDVTLQRDVAIKVMHPHIARQTGFPERFLQEARSAARLKHSGIVQVHDFGQKRDLLYIVMEFIPGANLQQMLQDLKEEHKWVPLDEAVELVRQVSLALDYAHSKGVLHRDIKPSNIMLEPEPSPPLPYRPVLTDLGLARLVDSERITKEGTSLGTPAYMSPEQALGQPTDARSDVYSLGVLLFELAVGRPPFPAKTITEAIRYHTKEAPPSPRSIRADLPQALEDVILMALEKQPQDRYANAAALSAALQGVRDPVTEAAAAPTAIETSISLTTVYEKSLVQPRGPSVLKEFEAPSDLSQDWIQILAADKSTRSVAIKGEVMTIGRQEDRDLVLDDPKVSRQHARIEFDGSSYRIVDLNSSNGTYLGDAKLLPGIAEVWTPDKPLRIGDTVLRLVRARERDATVLLSDGTVLDRTRITTSAGQGRVGIYVKDTQLAVEPGSSTTASILVLNQGAEVEHSRVTVNGIPDEWWESSPADIQLMPGQQQEVTLTFHPPRSPQSRAGRHSIAVCAASGDEVAEVKRTLTVGAYSQFQSAMHPQKIDAGATARVTVQNQGNFPETFTLDWQDRAAELAFQPPQAQLTVPEGQAASVDFRAVPRQRRWMGGKKPHPFTAQVSPPKGEAQTHSGEVVSKGLIPIWLPPLAVALLVALIVLLRPRGPSIKRVWFEPSQPLAGQPVTVRWVVENAESVELQPFGIKVDPALGEYTFGGFGGATGITLVASNKSGSTQQALAISVLAPTNTPRPTDTPLPPPTDTILPPTETVLPPTDTVLPPTDTVLPPTDTLTPTPTDTLTPTPTDTLTPTPTDTSPPTPTYQTWTHDIKLLDNREIYHMRLTEAGQIRVRASWTGTQSDLALIINGPGQVGYYARRDGSSPLEVAYDVTSADLAAGDEWRVTVASFGSGRAEGNIEITYPSGSSTAPFQDQFVTKPGYASVVHVLVLPGPGLIEAQATWTGSPSSLAFIINGPGQVGYYARRDGNSPLNVSYDVTEDDTSHGDTWRVSLTSFAEANAQGSTTITYPTQPWVLYPIVTVPGPGVIRPRLTLFPILTPAP